jgi:hypothetical protein
MPWRRSKYRQVRYGRPDRENPFLPRRRRLQNHNSLAAHRENGIADVGCHRASDLGRGLQLHAKSNSVLPLPRRQRRPQFESPRAGLGLPYSQSSSGAFGAFGGNVGGSADWTDLAPSQEWYGRTGSYHADSSAIQYSTITSDQVSVDASLLCRYTSGPCGTLLACEFDSKLHF